MLLLLGRLLQVLILAGFAELRCNASVRSYSCRCIGARGGEQLDWNKS
jgi:hypothetical protein